MSLSSNTSVSVADRTTASSDLTDTLLPPVGVGTGGRGRLVHPTLGTYDYANTPDETVNVEVVASMPPLWLHSQTISGAVETRWLGVLQGMRVVERWLNGDVGALLTHLNQLWTFYANPPNPDAASYVTWAPNYAHSAVYNVVIVGLRCGGTEYTLNQRLKGYGYAPQPVELEMSIVSVE